ncbi:carboxymuconolactone decarboxylase family protein [Pseudochelatococcus sp. B33]
MKLNDAFDYHTPSVGLSPSHLLADEAAGLPSDELHDEDTLDEDVLFELMKETFPTLTARRSVSDNLGDDPGALGTRERQLTMLAVVAAVGSPRQLREHTRAAVACGITPAELKAIVHIVARLVGQLRALEAALVLMTGIVGRRTGVIGS